MTPREIQPRHNHRQPYYHTQNRVQVISLLSCLLCFNLGPCRCSLLIRSTGNLMGSLIVNTKFEQTKEKLIKEASDVEILP